MIKNALNMRYSLKSCEAVSEVMDFVIILGILIISLSIIGLGGYPMLKNNQKNMNVEYTRQNFILLANTINKIPLGQAPSQSMELKVFGGTLSVTGDSRIYITAKNSAGDTIILADQQMRSIESSIEDTIIAYEGTGVWVKYPTDEINIYRPLITSQGNSLIIPVIKINGFSSVAGKGTSRITAKGIPDVTFYTNLSNITMTINSNYLDGWRDYYRDIMHWSDCLPGACTVQLNASNIDVYILNIQLDTEIE